MLIVDCPYCKEEINILFGEEIKNLLIKNASDCKCDYCNRVFEIYQGKDRYKVRKK